MLELMAAPFAECLVLVGIHTYLGIHVLRRRVIFVDLALAQIAALGTTVGFFFGILPETPAALVFSMAFAFVGAGVFSLTRIKGEKVPQEAIIGLTYAVTAALAVLVVEKTQGAEHLKDILVGSILWVKWSDVATAAIAYVVVGVVHYIYRKQFLLISEDPDEAYRRGMAVRGWDFLFYLTFGFVIAFSVRVAGVLLVFVFLVAPAIMAFLISDKLKHQLAIGWTMGTVVTIIGLGLSYVIDLPSGPTVVAFYGVALALGAMVLYVVRASDRTRAVKWVGIGIVTTVCGGGLFYYGARWLASTSWAHSHEHEHVEEEIHRTEAAAVTRQKEKEKETLTNLEGSTKGRIPAEQLRKYATLPDADEKLEFIKKRLESEKSLGLELLYLLLADEQTPTFYRSEAVDLLQKSIGQDFGYDPDAEPAANGEALQSLRRHLDGLSSPQSTSTVEANATADPERSADPNSATSDPMD